MSRIHRRSTKADLRLETLEGRITLTTGLGSAKHLTVIVDAGLTQTGIPQGQLHALKQFEKIQNVTKAERFLFNHPKFGAWYTLNVLSRPLPTGTTTGTTTDSPSNPKGPLPGHNVPGPNGHPIVVVFGAGSSGSSNTTSTGDSAGSTGTTTGTTTGGTTDSPSIPQGPLPGHDVPGPNGHPIAVVFGAGSSGSSNTTSTSDSAGSTGTTTDNPDGSQGTLPGHTVTDSSGHPIAIVF